MGVQEWTRPFLVPEKTRRFSKTFHPRPVSPRDSSLRAPDVPCDTPHRAPSGSFVSGPCLPRCEWGQPQWYVKEVPRGPTLGPEHLVAE